MNLISRFSVPSKFLFHLALKFRRLQLKKRSNAFGRLNTKEQPIIEHIYVINLSRQPNRWNAMKRELEHILDGDGVELWNITQRFNAVDASHFLQEPMKDDDLDPHYTLEDQLFVEPQPLTLPTQFELTSPIQMTRPEIAVARSHIDIWRKIVASDHEYALILEDDVWFRSGFAKKLDKAWSELKREYKSKKKFDVLYLSYEEVKYGAPKTFISKNVFRPERGLWHLSGYVVSREGAQKLLHLLPCRGPIDLWINHQFALLDVLALRESVISQRRDFYSTNSYSILPTLTKIGAINSESAALFHIRPNEQPVFAFGSVGSGLSSLAMALSMLGYRCCSDLQTLPASELEMLLGGKGNRVFDAYVNIKLLTGEIETLRSLYPQAKFIITKRNAEIGDDNNLKVINDLKGINVAILNLEETTKWRVICEYLKCAPPVCSFPQVPDLGQRELLVRSNKSDISRTYKSSKRDKLPWVIEPSQLFQGIHSVPNTEKNCNTVTPVCVSDNLKSLDTRQWFLRNDTFTDNLALFRPSNIEFPSGLGAVLSIKKEPLGVRKYSAAALTSITRFLYGRFEVIIKASNVSGVVTGFFLHRDSPRQEIDIEIAGNRPDRLLINVFYNPGGEGARFDYGYRGAPTYINLGFDASESYHQFAIEWGPSEIRWFVDNRLVHRRVEWDPTPIPHLPMALHVNTWPCRSKELAGRLNNLQLPATTFVKSIVIKANQHQNLLLL